MRQCTFTRLVGSLKLGGGRLDTHFSRMLSLIGYCAFLYMVSLPTNVVAKTITTGGYFVYTCGDLGTRLSLGACITELNGIWAKGFSECMALNSGNPLGFTCTRRSIGVVTRGGAGYIITSQNGEPPWYDGELVIYTISKNSNGDQSEGTSTTPYGIAFPVGWTCPKGFGGRSVNLDLNSTVRDSICERYEPDPPNCSNDSPPQVGNPIDPSMADKIQTETDYTSANGTLKLVYRSFSARGINLSNGDAYLTDFTSRSLTTAPRCTYRMASYYDRNPPLVHEVGICTPYTRNDSTLPPNNAVYITLENGQQYQFFENAGTFTSISAKGERLSYNASTSEWYFSTPSSEMMVFNNLGRRTSTISSSGKVTTYTYVNNAISTQSDHFGRTLQFFRDHV